MGKGLGITFFLSLLTNILCKNNSYFCIHMYTSSCHVTFFKTISLQRKAPIAIYFARLFLFKSREYIVALPIIFQLTERGVHYPFHLGKQDSNRSSGKKYKTPSTLNKSRSECHRVLIRRHMKMSLPFPNRISIYPRFGVDGLKKDDLSRNLSEVFYAVVKKSNNNINAI